MITVDTRGIKDLIRLGDADLAGLLTRCATGPVFDSFRAEIERRALAMPEVCEEDGLFAGYRQTLADRRAIAASLIAHERGWNPDHDDWARPIYRRGIRVA
jgi:hypothetical protein